MTSQRKPLTERKFSDQIAYMKRATKERGKGLPYLLLCKMVVRSEGEQAFGGKPWPALEVRAREHRPYA
jgi:hypothetical protein